ncbi:hypothetical protein OCH239_03990 [Roseivivax halodurans JCM 10272]|uniref:DUF58 domain-containing protein n=1 Tax=Roseivivax halodurans JCM 10272 TaxID=1449350 RepID=X7EDS3_9RHOB|nr:DUF58 domain-containing protein [Roseivivax halodurans]ETX14239.1 hypothetical protein OCH239_03990 [Roseivivax halodurans JCM 10272]
MKAALQSDGVALDVGHLIGLRALARHGPETPPLSRQPGGFVARRRGHGQEMEDTREYVPGDDIRHLDRGSTARTGVLHVRSFRQDADRVTLLVADFRTSMLWGIGRALRSVAAAEALALVGWRSVEAGGRVGLLALGDDAVTVTPVRGRARGMLGAIGGMVRAHRAALDHAAVGGGREPPLEAGLARLRWIAPPGSEIVIASGFDGAGRGLADRLDEISRRRVPRLLSVIDGAALRLPRGLYPVRLPDGTRIRVTIDGKRAVAAEGEVLRRPALTIDADAAPEDTARLIRSAFPPDRAP